mmetsp:Transcript_87313/g.260493  ORF Transcript_87313/g.260493 Transcript_87313/m.260493 type:complete len:230 (-) Transcript_87313:986-1675(-)
MGHVLVGAPDVCKLLLQADARVAEGRLVEPLLRGPIPLAVPPVGLPREQRHPLRASRQEHCCCGSAARAGGLRPLLGLRQLKLLLLLAPRMQGRSAAAGGRARSTAPGFCHGRGCVRGRLQRLGDALAPGPARWDLPNIGLPPPLGQRPLLPRLQRGGEERRGLAIGHNHLRLWAWLGERSPRDLPLAGPPASQRQRPRRLRRRGPAAGECRGRDYPLRLLRCLARCNR